MPSRTEILRTMRRPTFVPVPDEPEEDESPDSKEKEEKSGEESEKLQLAS